MLIELQALASSYPTTNMNVNNGFVEVKDSHPTMNIRERYA